MFDNKLLQNLRSETTIILLYITMLQLINLGRTLAGDFSIVVLVLSEVFIYYESDLAWGLRWLYSCLTWCRLLHSWNCRWIAYTMASPMSLGRRISYMAAWGPESVSRFNKWNLAVFEDPSAATDTASLLTFCQSKQSLASHSSKWNNAPERMCDHFSQCPGLP